MHKPKLRFDCSTSQGVFLGAGVQVKQVRNNPNILVVEGENGGTVNAVLPSRPCQPSQPSHEGCRDPDPDHTVQMKLGVEGEPVWILCLAPGVKAHKAKTPGLLHIEMAKFVEGHSIVALRGPAHSNRIAFLLTENPPGGPKPSEELVDVPDN